MSEQENQNIEIFLNSIPLQIPGTDYDRRVLMEIREKYRLLEIEDEISDFEIEEINDIVKNIKNA